MEKADVLVIGGGIAGASCALFLSEAGLDVTLLERGALAGEASGVNAGMIDAPGEAEVPDLDITLKMGSREIFRSLQVDRGHDIGFRESGELVLLANEAELEWAESLPLPSGMDLIDRRTVRSIEPNLTDNVMGALHIPGGSCAEPADATLAAAVEAGRAGARVVDHTEVTAIERSAGGVTVTTAAGRYGADALVIAAGAWSAEVGRMLGFVLPIQPVRGQMWATEPLPPRLFNTVAGAESASHWTSSPPTEPPDVTHIGGARVTRHLYGRQRSNGEVIFGGDRVPGSDRRVDQEAIESNHAHAAELLPFLRDAPPARVWSGLMPFTSDGRPLIGAIPDQSGTYVVGGLASSGFSRGPMAGRLLADLMTGVPTPSELSAADPAARVTPSP